MIDFLHVTDAKGLNEAIKLLKDSERIAIDTETMAPKAPARRAGFSNIYNRLKSGEMAPFDPHTSEVRLVQLRGDTTLPIVIDVQSLTLGSKEALSAFLGSYKGTYIGHNIRFDAKMIAGNLGVWLDQSGANIFDTMQASILISNGVGLGRERGHRLLDLARDFLGQDLNKTEQASDWSTAKLSEEQLEYAALDVTELHRLMDILMDSVTQLGMLLPLQIDMDVLMPTARMEFNGVPLSLDTYRKVQEAAQWAMPSLLSQIGKYFQEKINQPLALTYLPIRTEPGVEVLKPFMLPWGGGKVGKDFLMSRAGLVKNMLIEYGLTDDNGEPLESTEKAILETYREAHSGIGLLLDYWTLVKQSQFNYEDYINPMTGRMHPRFQPGGATTGRFSCTTPNLQQVPGKAMLKHPDGSIMNFRQAFKAPKGWLMCSADFSGQETAVMAVLSQDVRMIKTLNEGGDLHTEACVGMFGIDPSQARDKKPGDESGKTYRDYGKIINFSLAYGKTAEGFAKDWKIPKKEAEEIVQRYAKTFPQLTRWLSETGEIGNHQSYSRLLNGAMRFVGDGKRSDKDAAKRASSNYAIQGLSSWMTRRAMILLDGRIREEELPIELIACIHDELLALFKYSDDCLTAKMLLEGKDGKEVKESCLASCKEEHCAARYEAIIGECMEAAGREILQSVVPAGFSVATTGHWKH